MDIPEEQSRGEAGVIRKPSLLFRAPLPTVSRKNKVGLLTRAILSSRGAEEDFSASPNSLRNLIDPYTYKVQGIPMATPLEDADEDKSPENGKSKENFLHKNVAVRIPQKPMQRSISNASALAPSSSKPGVGLGSRPCIKNASGPLGRLNAPIIESKTPNAVPPRDPLPFGNHMKSAKNGNASGSLERLSTTPTSLADSITTVLGPPPDRVPVNSHKKSTKRHGGVGNISGPLERLNAPITESKTPNLRPPPPPLLNSHKKSAKKSGGSGWKFANDTVSGKEYLILKELGKGGCGEVHLVMEKESRNLFAMKKVNLAGFDSACIQECINEVTMLIELKDSELVIHIESWEMNQADSTMKIIMEYGVCDLNKLMQSSRQCLLQLKFTWQQLLKIVEVIHSKGIVHSDLKPANFVLVRDKLKIIDFGISNKLQTDHTSIATLNPKGTLNFISPETIRPDAMGRVKVGPKSDIWALGCILYQLVYGKTPFQDITHQFAKMNAILSGEISYPPLPPELRNSSVISVLQSCFELDSKKRPTATELLEHPFLRDH